MESIKCLLLIMNSNEINENRSQNDENKNLINDSCVEEEIGFLDNMVKKCEVNSYREMFLKLVHKKGDLIRCDDLFDKDAKYSLEKIKKDILPIQELILIRLFDPRPIQNLNQNSLQNNIPPNQFSKIFYISNIEGLIRVIKNYRGEKFIPMDYSITDLFKLWEIRSEEHVKLFNMIKNLTEQKRLYLQLSTKIIETPNDQSDHSEFKGLMIHFPSLMQIPEKRKKVLELLFTIIIFITLLGVLIKLTLFR